MPCKVCFLINWSLPPKNVFSRAVLSPSKVVLMDEATANVDADTDKQLQEVKINVYLSKSYFLFHQVIQNCLADRTVLTIAHRVDTVLGCDR